MPLARHRYALNRPGILMAIVASMFVGLVGGWFAGRKQIARQSTSPTDTSASDPRQPISYSANLERLSPPEATAKSFSPAQPSLAERLAMIRWLKANQMGVWMPLVKKDGVSDEFVQLYGLTPQEASALHQAILLATQEMEDLKMQHVQLDPASTPDKTIVTVAAFPKEGGRVYDKLQSKFSAILGQERYTVFNEHTGNHLELALDGLGMARHRYEITLDPLSGEAPRYQVIRSFNYDLVDYGAGRTGTSSGTSTDNGLEYSAMLKSFSFLKSFPVPQKK